jgi:dihydroflavonol-4-reductase
MPIEIVVTDMRDGDLAAICTGCDTVFHTAAQFAYAGVDGPILHETAVDGTERLLRGCAHAGVGRVVVTSSSVVFGFSKAATEIDEDSGLASADGQPRYVAAKLAQHQVALRLGRQFRLDVRLACPAMTLGPTSGRLGPSNGLIAAYLADPFRCTFPGGCNLVAVRDVAVGHLLIAEHGAAGESYLLGSQNMTWPQIHAAIAELAGVAVPHISLNYSQAYLAAAADELRAALSGRIALSTREQAGMIGRYYWYSHAKAAQFGYTPVAARDALIEAISWLAASSHISRETRITMRLSDDIYRFRAAQEPAH